MADKDFGRRSNIVQKSLNIYNSNKIMLATLHTTGRVCLITYSGLEYITKELNKIKPDNQCTLHASIQIVELLLKNEK